ncbi:hypothetical protein MHU86_17554 [Fragilaria crotonensis]|nr:hypothetical protein MHU86_17554 [Fragilaria crotonensis]
MTTKTNRCELIESNAPPPALSIRASSRKNRVYVFREFLLRTYPTLLAGSMGSTILDVAGGKGDLSWLLLNVDRMESIVVDPQLARPISSTEAFEALLNNDLIKAAELSFLQGFVSVGWLLGNGTEGARQSQPIGHQENKIEGSTAILDPQEGLKLLLDTKLVVGFHPDQATEACIDLALLLGISYCVVPCCVFPSEFQDRLTPEGTRVRSYHELLAYLLTKDPLHMKTAELGFHETTTARRIVLYRVVEEGDVKLDLLPLPECRGCSKCLVPTTTA